MLPDKADRSREDCILWCSRLAQPLLVLKASCRCPKSVCIYEAAMQLPLQSAKHPSQGALQVMVCPFSFLGLKLAAVEGRTVGQGREASTPQSRLKRPPGLQDHLDVDCVPDTVSKAPAAGPDAGVLAPGEILLCLPPCSKMNRRLHQKSKETCSLAARHAPPNTWTWHAL